MGLGSRFRRKKGNKVVIEPEKVVTELDKICGSDTETCEALLDTMFLDPRKIKTSIEEAAENAKKSEREKDFTKAVVWYEIAGGLAIYEGDVKKMIEYFKECEKLMPYKKRTILKNPEKAVAIAQEYYAKYLKN